MKKFVFILVFSCCADMCAGQQVVSSGGYAVKSDLSVNWILGGSLSAIDQSASFRIQDEQNSAPEVRFKVYPVPATDFLNIEIAPIDTGRFSLEIYSSSGVKVITKVMPYKPVMQVDVSNLPSGMYVLKVSNPSVSSRLPVVEKILKF